MTRVIICEDEPLLAMDLAFVISDAGGQVCGTFSSAEDALKFAENFKPDLAIVDLNLADGATGIDVAAAMEKLGCKVVVISGGERDNGRIFSIDHTFISKPVPTPVFAEILRNCCGGLAATEPTAS